ncbi:MAG: YicC/YloC family endoribonuclease [Nitrospirota bacterium]
MIQSMTGYARSEWTGEGKSYVAEIRSVNHKYCDVSIKLPRTLLSLEGMVKGIIQKEFSRGKFDVIISRNGSDDYAKRLVLDEELVRQYFNILQDLKARFGLKGEIDINLLSGFSDMIKVSPVEEDEKEVARILKRVLHKAIISLIEIRNREGQALYNDIAKRLNIVLKAINKIERLSGRVFLTYHKKLRERIAAINKSLKIDHARLAQEVALIAERCDITEEIVRFKSHVNQFKRFLSRDKGVGRKLDFLIQEMNREVNTLGSKANDAVISIEVVNIKNELEKIREQVQNIE